MSKYIFSSKLMLVACAFYSLSLISAQAAPGDNDPNGSNAPNITGATPSSLNPNAPAFSPRSNALEPVVSSPTASSFSNPVSNFTLPISPSNVSTSRVTTSSDVTPKPSPTNTNTGPTNAAPSKTLFSTIEEEEPISSARPLPFSYANALRTTTKVAVPRPPKTPQELFNDFINDNASKNEDVPLTWADLHNNTRTNTQINLKDQHNTIIGMGNLQKMMNSHIKTTDPTKTIFRSEINTPRKLVGLLSYIMSNGDTTVVFQNHGSLKNPDQKGTSYMLKVHGTYYRIVVNPAGQIITAFPTPPGYTPNPNLPVMRNADLLRQRQQMQQQDHLTTQHRKR